MERSGNSAGEDGEIQLAHLVPLRSLDEQRTSKIYTGVAERSRRVSPTARQRSSSLTERLRAENRAVRTVAQAGADDLAATQYPELVPQR